MQYKVRILTQRQKRRREDLVLEGTLPDILKKLPEVLIDHEKDNMMITFEPLVVREAEINHSTEAQLPFMVEEPVNTATTSI